MNLSEFNVKYAGLRQSDKIEIKCEHPQCLDPVRVIGREAARRNIIKNGGNKFVCGTCDKRFNNAMTKVGQGRKNLGEIDVECPGCKETRKMQGVCYFGPLDPPYRQICKSCSNIGRVVTEEQKQKISKTLSGRKLTEEHKESISEYMKNNPEGIARGKANLVPGIGGGWNKGQETPQEVRDKQSAAMSGRIYSDEHKLNISEGRKRMLAETGGFSLEHRQKLREAALRQYEGGFEPNNHHRSGWHESPLTGKIFHRSSYEKKAFIILDNMVDVRSYKVESIRIPYWNPLRKSESIFIVDLLVEFSDDSKMVIEVKPTSWLSSLVNVAKIDALRAWAEKENFAFEIWDEFTLFGEDNTYKKVQKFVDWLDSSGVGDTDTIAEEVVEIRRASSRIRSKRHYQKNLSQKITIHCDWCKQDHAVREITYKQHMEKYGRYICASEYGSIGGGRSKERKENPFAAEGKKQCAGECNQVKSLDEFGSDKHRPDGKARICKICRAKKATEKYKQKKNNEQD